MKRCRIRTAIATICQLYGDTRAATAAVEEKAEVEVEIAPLVIDPAIALLDEAAAEAAVERAETGVERGQGSIGVAVNDMMIKVQREAVEDLIEIERNLLFLIEIVIERIEKREMGVERVVEEEKTRMMMIVMVIGIGIDALVLPRWMVKRKKRRRSGHLLRKKGLMEMMKKTIIYQ